MGESSAISHLEGCTGFPPTVACPGCIAVARAPVSRDDLSSTRRLTKRNAEMLALGVHPATRQPISPELGRCGDCAHSHRLTHHSRAYWKCDLHRLGMSHSEGSDIRISWPACTKFELQVQP